MTFTLSIYNLLIFKFLTIFLASENSWRGEAGVVHRISWFSIFQEERSYSEVPGERSLGLDELQHYKTVYRWSDRARIWSTYQIHRTATGSCGNVRYEFSVMVNCVRFLKLFEDIWRAREDSIK